MTGLFSAIRSRRINGAVYMHQDDVIRFLVDTANDWVRTSRSEQTIVTSDCVRQLADQLKKVR